MTFIDVLNHCVNNVEFVHHWARLRGVKLPKSGIEAAIDEASGYNADIAKMFIEDVHDIVWSRLAATPATARTGAGPR